MSAEESLLAVVRRLVGQPERARVLAAAGGDEAALEVSIAAADRGQVIGRHGRTVKALRTLLAVRDERHGRRHRLEVIDD